MRALTIVPNTANSLSVQDVPEPDSSVGDVLVEAIAVGVCGTDRDLAAGAYGWAPAGQTRLVIGHEGLGRVREAPADSAFQPGDLIVGVVRMPDPQPCQACAHGEWDMCRNGQYTEHGIKELNGFASEVWRVHAGHAVKLDPSLESVGMLLEPVTVVAKAWDQVDKIGNRSWFEPTSVLVTGAGPIGLLAALIGKQRGLEVHVLDRATDGIKPDLVAALGATYHSEAPATVLAELQPDIIIEATAAAPVVQAVLGTDTSYAITVLTGISNPGELSEVDLGAVNRSIVMANGVVVGSVNANLAHYEAAAKALAAADRSWLERLITRRVPLDQALEAFETQPNDVKVVVTFN